MFICDNCGKIVEDLPKTRYYHNVPGNSAVSGYIEEADDECGCGGNYFEAGECERCGDLFPRKKDWQTVCEKCKQEVEE